MPRAGRRYAAERNFDHGPAERANVSTLSPYLRTRALSETEVLEAVLETHPPAAAEKFISEVFWRTYWKGWLQAHPQTWSSYRDAVRSSLEEVERRPTLAVAYGDATAGRTGIDAFDAWIAELAATNYLHNHARMWFASIWIFTLHLPWELGADLFMRHLLDGDPASNTLSWRWVAGLHTRGKTYAATRDNIRRYTGERFTLDAPLARSPAPLTEPPPARQPQPEVPDLPLDDEPTLLVVHDDDLRGDGQALPPRIRGVCAVVSVAGRSPRPVDERVLEFTADLAADVVGRLAAERTARDFGVVRTGLGMVAPTADRLADHARRCGATRIVAPFAPVGPVREVLDALAPRLEMSGLRYREAGRRFDALAWPAATGGFFGLRRRIPSLLAALEPSTG